MIDFPAFLIFIALYTSSITREKNGVFSRPQTIRLIVSVRDITRVRQIVSNPQLLDLVPDFPTGFEMLNQTDDRTWTKNLDYPAFNAGLRFVDYFSQLWYVWLSMKRDIGLAGMELVSICKHWAFCNGNERRLQHGKKNGARSAATFTTSPLSAYES